ncbi:hypothetical protein ACLOJK_014540, partial [Asimina triloba]
MSAIREERKEIIGEVSCADLVVERGREASVGEATTVVEEALQGRRGRGVVVAATGAEEALRRCRNAGEAVGTTETALREGQGAVVAIDTVGQFFPAANVMAMGEKSMWRYIYRVIDGGTWMKRCGMDGSKDLWSLRVNPPPGTNPKASTVDMLTAKRNTSCS